MSIIIGIDPGSRFTGVGLIDMKDEDPVHVHHGVIAIPESLPFERKLRFLAQELGALYVHFRPACTVVEKIFLGKNADSAFKLGHVRGVCFHVAAVADNPVFEYASRTVKKSVTGHGGASKDHVRLVVSRLLRVSGEVQYDATDALAMALCHSRTLTLQERFNRQPGRVQP